MHLKDISMDISVTPMCATCNDFH